MWLLIGNDKAPGSEWLGQPLKGEWPAHREHHIGGDCLLICRADADAITFVRAGSHADPKCSAMWAHPVHAAGNSTRTSNPCPAAGVLRLMCAPCRCAIARTMARPKPLPPPSIAWFCAASLR